MARFQGTSLKVDKKDIDVVIDDSQECITPRGHFYHSSASSSDLFQGSLASRRPWAEHVPPHYEHQRASANFADMERMVAEVCNESMHSASDEPEAEDDLQDEPIMKRAPTCDDAGTSAELESFSGSHMCLNLQNLVLPPGVDAVRQPIGAPSELLSHGRNVPMSIPKMPPGDFRLAPRQASSMSDNVMQQVQEVQREQLKQQQQHHQEQHQKQQQQDRQQQQHRYTAQKKQQVSLVQHVLPTVSSVQQGFSTAIFRPGNFTSLPCSIWVAPPLPTETSAQAQSLPSVGSLGHPLSCAAPCKYFAKPRGCKDGDACDRCHECSWRSFSTHEAKTLGKTRKNKDLAHHARRHVTNPRCMHPPKF
eukprot:TRINITY_DN16843_c0_g1_i1.p1 TRINITY_DN16843_c0_g1~~TRINITY_DN16843_c0_g1_i1.p1  ORF type:complete len:383 (-),score=76.37 TRINITY_DN16843_c0_g1_i1:68-1156(-)